MAYHSVWWEWRRVTHKPSASPLPLRHVPQIEMTSPGGPMVKNPPTNAGDTWDVGSIRVRKIPWSGKWQPTPVFLPGKPHGERSLAGHSPWGRSVGRNCGSARTQLEVGPDWEVVANEGEAETWPLDLGISIPPNTYPRALPIYWVLLTMYCNWIFRSLYLPRSCKIFKKSESRSTMSDSLRLHGLYGPWNSPGQNTGVGSPFLLYGIFPTHKSNPGLPHCRQIVYQPSHKESPRIMEWVDYPFSSRSSWPRNQTRVSCIAGRFFTNWAMREALLRKTIWFCNN